MARLVTKLIPTPGAYGYVGGLASWNQPSSPSATRWFESIDLIYAEIVDAHLLMVLPVVSHALEAEPDEPEQRGSLASSQAMMVGSLA